MSLSTCCKYIYVIIIKARNRRCWRPCCKALEHTEIWAALSYRQLLFPEDQTLGVAILVHNRFILIHKTGITLWLQSKTSGRNILADLLQLWSLTRTHGESAINHTLRLEHYKVQGRQALSSRSELIKKNEKRKKISVPVSVIVFKWTALKDIIHPVPCLHPISFQGWSAFCLLPFTLTQMTVLGKRQPFGCPVCLPD